LNFTRGTFLALKGVGNVDGPAALDAIQALEQAMCGGPVVTQFVGGTPAEVPERYRQGALTGLLPTGAAQIFLVHAEAGPEWTALIEPHVETARKAGDPARMEILKGRGHFDGIDPQAQDWSVVLAAVQSLVRAR
jgi:hypothetical protein